MQLAQVDVKTTVEYNDVDISVLDTIHSDSLTSLVAHNVPLLWLIVLLQ